MSWSRYVSFPPDLGIVIGSVVTGDENAEIYTIPTIQFHANNSTFKVLIFNHPRENFLTYDEKVGRQLLPLP